jgi:hypothetical protein
VKGLAHRQLGWRAGAAHRALGLKAAIGFAPPPESFAVPALLLAHTSRACARLLIRWLSLPYGDIDHAYEAIGVRRAALPNPLCSLSSILLFVCSRVVCAASPRSICY